jgi:hypothetical protein
MSEKDLTKLGLLEEFSITELEQRLEFEAWCDDCTCTDTTCPSNYGCIPIDNAYCGGGGGGGGGTDDSCLIDVQP